VVSGLVVMPVCVSLVYGWFLDSAFAFSVLFMLVCSRFVAYCFRPLDDTLVIG
jgi:hypothetical protein